MNWPTSELDTVARLRVLAAGVRGAHITEQVIDAPFDDVWAMLADLEGDFGEIVTDMQGVTVLGRDGDRVTLRARSRFGMRARIEGTQRPGWCWLQSRFLLIGIAAAPLGAQTLVAFTGGVRIPGRAALVPVGVRREGRHSLARLAQRVDAGH
ncbi:hypothetical protein [Phytoactinopolyspora endophytica]|uniref:hypothetical protein n=1 Tax=Phytoactinopolyspora endophytica TaxID=1642495 RepID=UPI00197C3DB7|nr:hypothetical protein [Phytoactinopolyspora endophytica]